MLAALTLCWPMLGGRFLLGDDQYVAGYSFRLYGAEMFRETGHIPQWNPYLFGGLPFIAAMHGDIFYPTAWLRWFLPVDTAMNLGFALHLVLAGFAMYAPPARPRSVVGRGCRRRRRVRADRDRGLAGEAGSRRQAVRLGARAARLSGAGKGGAGPRIPVGYALLALVVGLGLLSPHYQMTYYLLVAAGLWALYLVVLRSGAPVPA